MIFIFLFFFFSSRRRHTRLQGDWSSDVCSSDLYWIAERIETWSVGYNPPLANQYMANFESTYGCFIFGSDPNNCAQSDLFFQWGSFFMPAVDFKWRETLILPDATDASALLEGHNLAPTGFHI